MALTKVADAGLVSPSTDLQDNDKLTLGTGDDLEIYHSSDISRIRNTNDSGTLKIQATSNGENAINIVPNGTVQLYYDGSIKAETRSDGFEIKQHLTMGDNDEVRLGNSGDLKLYHDGSHSYIDNKTGNLYIRANTSSDVGGDIHIRAKAGESSISCYDDGTVELFYNNFKSCSTNSAGIDLYGPESGDCTLNMNADEGDDNADKWRLNAGTGGVWQLKNYAPGSWDVLIDATVNTGVGLFYDNAKKIETTSSGWKSGDNVKGVFGDGQDIQIYHDGTDSHIYNQTGTLKIRGSDVRLMHQAGNEITIRGVANGAAELYYDNVKKFETLSTGAKVTGTLEVTEDYVTTMASGYDFWIDRSGNKVQCGDNISFRCGNAGDLQLYHDGTNSYINEAGTGSLIIASNGPGIWFQKDVSSSENLAVFRTDGACELNYDSVKKFETISAGAAVSGSLGVGTTSPSYPIHLKGTNGSDSGDVTLRIDAGTVSSNSATNNAVLDLTARGKTSGGNAVTQNCEIRSDGQASNGAVLSFHTDDASANLQQRMCIDSRGQVGFGDGADALPPTGNENRVRIMHDFDHGVDGNTFQNRSHLLLQNDNAGISGTGPGGGNYSLGVLTLNGTHSNGSVRGTKICGAEKLSIYVNDNEDALDQPTILMDQDWIHMQGASGNREIFLDTYTGNSDQACIWLANDGHRVDGGQTDGRGTFSVDANGRIWAKQTLFLGRSRNVSGNTNFYENVGTGIQIYHGDSSDSTQYCQRFSITPYSGSDMGDFNIMSWWTNGAGTGQVDTSDTAGNTDLKLSIKASGRIQGASHFFCGRVEGSDGSPTSTYTDASQGIFTYGNNAEARAYMHGYASPSSSNWSFYSETGTSTSNDDIQFKVRATDGRIYSDYGASVTHGADYAEYFEWKDGNPSNEDRVGKTVVLEDGKIRLATDSDDKSKIIGIISATPAVVGDSADLKWQGRWLKDDFGRDVTDDVELLVWNHGKHEFQPEQSDTFHLNQCDSTIRVSEIEEGLKDGRVPQWAVDQNLRVVAQERKKNPDYDPKKGYIPREDRKEWDAVGLVGKLYVYKDQPKGTNWIKLSDKTSTIERWLVR